MALANFFERAEHALRHVLLSVDPEVLRKQIQAKNVALIFDSECLNYSNSEIMIELVVNLLARLYPKIGVVCTETGQKENEFISKLDGLAYSINPQIEIIHENTQVDIAVCVGEPKCEAATKVYIGANSWNLELRIGQPTPLLKKNVFNPFSASAVAALGVSEIFKFMFADSLNNVETKDIKLSLLDYSGEFSDDFELPEVWCEDLTLVGVGAIGNAAIWCLQHVPQLRGKITLIDSETVDLTNLQRYVLTNQDSVNCIKVDLAKQVLEREGLQVCAFPNDLGDYVQRHRPECKFDVMAISVDNAESRVAAQALLPRVILNGWTGSDGNLGVSRHQFDHPTDACLACMYISKEKTKSRTEEIADIVGLEQSKVNEMVVRNEPLTSEILEEIADKKGYPSEILNKFLNKTLEDFYTEFVCGGILLSLGDVGQKEEAIVPLAHQSVFAGILLACETVKELLGIVPENDPINKQLSIFSLFPGYIRQHLKKVTRVKCICTDSDYLEVYKGKYSLNPIN